MQFLSRLHFRLAIASLIGLTSSVFVARPTWGAERIQFFYGPVEPTIAVDDLEAIAKRRSPRDLSGILDRLSHERQQTLRSFLNTRFDVDAVTVSRLSYSAVGENLLHRIGQVVQTENFLNGSRALRSALILAAADDDGLSVLNVIRHFPLDTIQLNLPLALTLVEENQRIFQRQVSVVADIHQLADTNATSETVRGDRDPRQRGTYPWQVETLTFQNPQRARASVADLYLPERPSNSIPVVVISHGSASNRQTFAYLAEHFASHGYAVVVPEHPDSSTDKFARFLNGLEGPPNVTSLLQRPRDITAVLDKLEQQGRSLDLDNVGVLGQSIGGYTALAAAGTQLNRTPLQEACGEPVGKRPLLNLSMLVQCRLLELPNDAPSDLGDDRVRAVLAINPLTSHFFGAAGLARLDVPVLLVAGSDDYFVPALPEQIKPFAWLQVEEKYLVVVENGTHFSMLGEEEETGPFPVPEFLIGPDPKLAHPPMRAIGLAFFDRHLRDRGNGFLTQSYLNTFEVEPFRFSLVRRLSETIEQKLDLEPK
jgi:predicted dienelactone hydrolase